MSFITVRGRACRALILACATLLTSLPALAVKEARDIRQDARSDARDVRQDSYTGHQDARQDARDVRQDGRPQARDMKQDCRQEEYLNNVDCRQDKRRSSRMCGKMRGISAAADPRFMAVARSGQPLAAKQCDKKKAPENGSLFASGRRVAAYATPAFTMHSLYCLSTFRIWLSSQLLRKMIISMLRSCSSPSSRWIRLPSSASSLACSCLWRCSSG